MIGRKCELWQGAAYVLRWRLQPRDGLDIAFAAAGLCGPVAGCLGGPNDVHGGWMAAMTRQRARRAMTRWEDWRKQALCRLAGLADIEPPDQSGDRFTSSGRPRIDALKGIKTLQR